MLGRVTAGCNGAVMASAERSLLRTRANRPSNTKFFSPSPIFGSGQPPDQRFTPIGGKQLAESCVRNVTGSVRSRDYIMVKCRGRCLVYRPTHGKQAFDHGIFVVAATGDRLHGRSIEPAVDNEAVVDMHADDLAEHHVTVDRLAVDILDRHDLCLLYTSPSPRDGLLSRMPSSA